MGVKRKGLYITAVLFIGLLVLHACTSYYDSITGYLEIVTYSQDMGDVESGAHDTEFLSANTQVTGSIEPEFIPGEIIVRYKPGLEPSGIQSLSTISAFVEQRSSGHAGSGVRSVLRLAEYERLSLSVDAVKDRTLREIEWLNSQPHVLYAQPNYIYRPLALGTQPNDTAYSVQWHYPLIKWDHVWDENLVTDLSDVIVAVIDTGIMRENWIKSSSNHEDFGGTGASPFVDEYDFILNDNYSLDGHIDPGRDNDATDMGDHPDPSEASFHGTHVAGTIGAYTNNSLGVASMAGRNSSLTSVKIMPLRAMGFGGGSTDDIVEAIKYAARLDNASGTLPSVKADIINMSFGGTGQDQDLENAINDAFNEDIVLVAAAGNTGSSIPFYPASYDNVISVSAVDIGGDIAYYSNYGSTIDVAAPGGDLSYNLNFDDINEVEVADGVLSTFTRIIDNQADTGTYYVSQGTSMAAPHVAGLAALIKAADPLLSAAEIRSIIENSTIDVGVAGEDNFYGHGLINAYASVHAALGTLPADQDPVLFPNPKLLKLQGDNPSTTFTLQNIGNTLSDISITDIVPKNNVSWLDIDYSPGNVEAGLDVQISIDSSSIADGSTHIEMLTIEAESGVADEYVYVLYNVSGFPNRVFIDIGTLYVIAEDAETGRIAAIEPTTYSLQYEYAIRNLATGSYIIKASTDHDGDGEYFESEDAIGIYKNSLDIVAIDVTAGYVKEGISFQVIVP